ncbi:MAG: hypothetical protein HN923_02040, partial [Euryarchaeota archaeon]|nr:hypothetical protein [Euryarchaeota archaeon]
MNKIHAVLFALMMLTVSLAGCFGSDDPVEDETPVETPVETLDDWQVHFASTAADLPTCDSATDGRLYYVDADSEFQVCTSSGWDIIDVSGPAGQDGADGTLGANGVDGADGSDGIDGADGSDGIDGTNGTDGQDGADGTDGNDGADGANGVSTLIRILSSTTCTTGGNSFEIGADNNGDGVLDITEVIVTVDICNGVAGPAGQDGADGNDGADGADGTNGTDGADGADGADGTNGTDGADGADGTNGTDGADGASGTAGTNGTDGQDGADGASGTAGTNGTDGTDGADGSASPNTMLTSISSPAASLGCTAGGRVMMQGLDNGDGGGTAQNGVLESGEVDYTTTYCSKYVIWQVVDIRSTGSSSPGQYMEILVGDTLYFSAVEGSSGIELWAHDTSNHSTWQVADINS